MNATDTNSAPARDNTLAVCLIGTALLVFLGWQSVLVWKNNGALARQAQQREQLVTQSTKVQGDLQKLANDLVTLGQTDADALTLVRRYEIKVTPPATK